MTYTENFPVNTPASVAEHDILETLPGASATAITLGQTESTGPCGEFVITSAAVAKELGKADPTGQIGVEFSYLDTTGRSAYSSSNVQQALVTFVPATSGSC